MLTRMVRFIFGYVRFRCYSAVPERFLALALSLHVKLSRVKKTPDGAIGYVSIKGYKVLARRAKSADARLRITSRYGVPFIVHKHRKRLGIYIGAAFFVGFLLFTQNFIWEIKLPEYDAKKSELLLKNLEEHGIFVGAFKPSLNMKVLQSKVLTDSEDLSWIALNVKGTKLYVELAETRAESQIESQTPCNIIARKTGQITEVNEEHGLAVVRPLEVVLAGELLISGTMQKADGVIQNIHAAGKVMAQTVTTHSITFSLNQVEKNYCEIKNRYSLNLFGIKIPLYIAFDLNHEYDMVSQELNANFFSQQMPYGLICDEYHMFTPENKTYSEAEATIEIEKAFREFEKTELNNAKILEMQQSELLDENVLTITRKYVCEENISQQVLI